MEAFVVILRVRRCENDEFADVPRREGPISRLLKGNVVFMEARC